MATTIRPELSTKSTYYISKERYMELKHWCLQYPEWKKALNKLSYLKASDPMVMSSSNIGDPVYLQVEQRNYYSKNIELIESVAKKADPELYSYILSAVTENVACQCLIARGMPCSRDKFYELYRRFFWILDIYRDGLAK